MPVSAAPAVPVAAATAAAAAAAAAAPIVPAAPVAAAAAATATGAFGSWDFFREAETVYRAETDGFVLAQVHGNGHLVLKGFCGEEESLDISIVAFENSGSNIKFSGFMPVPKGNYWKVTCAEGDEPEMVGVCWLPIQ